MFPSLPLLPLLLRGARPHLPSITVSPPFSTRTAISVCCAATVERDDLPWKYDKKDVVQRVGEEKIQKNTFGGSKNE